MNLRSSTSHEGRALMSLTEEIKGLIYKRFKKDFDTFGYER